jgi:hypothetical protein
MLDYVIIGLLLILVMPKMRIIYDEKGLRVLIHYVKYYNDPNSLIEGWQETTSQYWIIRNEEWWDKNSGL